MAIVDLDELIRFLKPHVALDLDGEGKPVAPKYARLRAGRTKKVADGAWRRDLGGADPKAIAQEVAERHARLSRGEKAWLEIMGRDGGQRIVLDTLPLGEAPERDAEENGGAAGFNELDPDSIGGHPIVAHLVNALVQTNGQVMSRLTATEDRHHELMMKHIELAATATADKVQLDWIQQFGLPGQADNAEFAEAVKFIGPMLGPAIGAMLSGKKNETMDQRADRLLAEVALVPPEVWFKEPGRREKVEQLVTALVQYKYANPDQKAA